MCWIIPNTWWIAAALLESRTLLFLSTGARALSRSLSLSPFNYFCKESSGVLLLNTLKLLFGWWLPICIILSAWSHSASIMLGSGQASLSVFHCVFVYPRMVSLLWQCGWNHCHAGQIKPLAIRYFPDGVPDGTFLCIEALAEVQPQNMSCCDWFQSGSCIVWHTSAFSQLCSHSDHRHHAETAGLTVRKTCTHLQWHKCYVFNDWWEPRCLYAQWWSRSF